MATDKRISELPPGAAVSDTDILALVQNIGLSTVEIAMSALAAYMQGKLQLGAQVTFTPTQPQNTTGKNGDIDITPLTIFQKVAGVWTSSFAFPLGIKTVDSVAPDANGNVSLTTDSVPQGTQNLYFNGGAVRLITDPVYLPLSGTKPMTGVLNANKGIDTDGTTGNLTLSIGTNNATVINIGNSAATVNIIANKVNEQAVTNMGVADKLITLNNNGPTGSGNNVGFQIQEGFITGTTPNYTGYFTTTADRNGYMFQAPGLSQPGTLDFSMLTAAQTLKFPNASGTIATQQYTASLGYAVASTVTLAMATANGAVTSTAVGLGGAATAGVPLTITNPADTGSFNTFTNPGLKFIASAATNNAGMSFFQSSGTLIGSVFSSGTGNFSIKSSGNIILLPGTGNILFGTSAATIIDGNGNITPQGGVGFVKAGLVFFNPIAGTAQITGGYINIPIANGQAYYNSTTGLFQFYQNSAWVGIGPQNTITNSTSLQASSNFNISGTGTAGNFNSLNYYSTGLDGTSAKGGAGLTLLGSGATYNGYNVNYGNGYTYGALSYGIYSQAPNNTLSTSPMITLSGTMGPLADAAGLDVVQIAGSVVPGALAVTNRNLLNVVNNTVSQFRVDANGNTFQVGTAVANTFQGKLFNVSGLDGSVTGVNAGMYLGGLGAYTGYGATFGNWNSNGAVKYGIWATMPNSANAAFTNALITLSGTLGGALADVANNDVVAIVGTLGASGLVNNRNLLSIYNGLSGGYAVMTVSLAQVKINAAVNMTNGLQVSSASIDTSGNLIASNSTLKAVSFLALSTTAATDQAGNYTTLRYTDHAIGMSGGFTLTLSGAPGQIFDVYRTVGSTGTITVVAVGGLPVESPITGTTATSVTLAAAGSYGATARFKFNGTVWQCIGH